jgi:hypothetical protein
VSIVASNIDDQYVATEKSNAGPDAAAGVGVGAVVGGGIGALAGLGMLAIPGVGPVVAAGWLVATAVGAVAGAGGATGGIVGSLTGSGVSKEHAHIYAEGVRRGGTLVTARVGEDHVAAVEQIMRNNHAVDPALRGRTYRDAGWETFDATANPCTPTELAEERQRNRDLTPVL